MGEENVAIRLKLLIEKLGLSNSAFAEACGMSRATLSQLLTGRNKKISDVVLSQVHKAFPGVSILWLLFNEGEMMNSGENLLSRNNADAGDCTESDGKSEFDVEDEDEFAENASINLKNSYSGTITSKNSKEKAVNWDENASKVDETEYVKYYSKIVDLQNEIENMKKKIKKVVQITVYYDDSTFENFYPK